MCRLSDLNYLGHVGDDFLKYLCRWCLITIGPERLTQEESENHVLGSVFGVAELEHQESDKLVQQEVGEDLGKVKTVVSHKELEVWQVLEVAMFIAIINYLFRKQSDCVDIEHDQVGEHHSMALLYILV